MNLSLSTMLLAAGFAQDANPMLYVEQRKGVTQAAEQTRLVVQANHALLCFLKDKQAVDERHEDIPDGWRQPSIETYDAEGATCSQIPLRQEWERIAQAAAEADPINAVQLFWTVEMIWANKGGPAANQAATP